MKDRKRSSSCAIFSLSIQKDLRFQMYASSALNKTAHRYYTPAGRRKVFLTYMFSNGISNNKNLPIVGGVTITFELMSDCAHTLPSIYDLNFLTTCLTALHFLPSLFHAAFHSSNLSPLMRLFHRLLFSCIWDPSPLCVSFSSC